MTPDDDEGEPGSPLFHPCKCSGSIRFVHQDCLLTWLQSSRRKYCELCGHAFSFTRVYDPSMPAQLPPLLFALRLLRQALKLLLLVLRSCLVGFTWIGLVPWLTIWAFRLYFVLGNGIAWSVSGQERPPPHSHHPNLTTSPNATFTKLTEALLPNLNSSDASNSSSFFIATASPQPPDSFFSMESLSRVARDTFEGQILTASIVLTFLAALLLREWTLQAPPRNDEIEDVEPLAAAPEDRLAAMPPLVEVPGRMQVVRVDLPPVLEGQLARDQLPSQENDEESEEENDQEPTDREALRRAREKYFGTSPGRIMENSDEERHERVPTSLSPKAIKHRQLRKRNRANSSSSSDSLPALKFEPVASSSTSKEPASVRKIAKPGRHRRQSAPESLSDSEMDEVTLEALADLKKPVDLPTRHAEGDFYLEPFDAPPATVFTFRATPPPPRAASLPSRLRTVVTPDPSPPPSEVADLVGSSRPASLSPPASSPATAASSSTQPPFFLPKVKAPKEGAVTETSVPAERQGANEEYLEEDPRRRQAAIVDLPGPALDPFRDVVEDEDDEAEEDGDADEDEEDPGPPLVEPLPLAVLAARVRVNEDGLLFRMGEDEEFDVDDGLREDEFEAQNARLLEEDLDGILDAIGLRGPILMLLQNSTLITFVLSMCLSFTVFLPFTLGKTLLLLNYLDVLRALKLPVTAVRLVTDPTINFVHLVGSRYILPPLDAALLPLIQVALSFLPPKAVVPVETAAEPSTLSLLLTIAQEKLLVVFTLAEQGLDRVCGLVSPDIASDSPPSAAWSYVVSKAPVIELLASTAVILGKEIGDAFALVGLVSRCAVDLVESIVEGRVDSVGFAALAQGDTSADRFFAIWVGYSSVILFLLLWFGTTSDKKGWGKATKEVFKQNAIVIKLAFFMSIELIVFPLGCGILLDFCLLPLFHERTGLARAAFHVRAPFISIFLHWVGGTLFMFGFASLLSHGRKQLRRGTFFFIRDPQDPTFQPVREILDRPTLNQIHKLGASAVMYFFVIFVSVGMTLNAIRWALPGVLPLLWKPSQPLSQIPIDLLALHFIAPPAMKVLRPHRRFRKIIEKWWSFSIDQLRLGSYFFDKPVTALNFTTESEIDTAVRLALDKVVRFIAKFTKKDVMQGEGGLVRVPNSDTLTLTANHRVFIRLDRKHDPIDDTELALLVAQNRKSTVDGRNPLDDYCVVYLPPYVRARVFVLLFSLWVSLVVLVGAFLSVPLAIGRQAFSIVHDKEVHDGYSFAAGATIALCNFLVSRSLLRKIRRWGQAERVRRTSLLGRIKRNIVWGCRVFYLAVAFGLVLPLAISLVFELYLVSPMKDGFIFSDPPVLFVWELWAMGLLWMHVLWTLRRFLPPTQFVRSLDRVIYHVSHLQGDLLTRDIILPVLSLCAVLIALPFVAVLSFSPLFGTPERRPAHARMIYPIVAATAVTFCVLHVVGDKLTIWRIKLRESEFLVELRLRNLDPSNATPQGPATVAATGSRPVNAFVPDHLVH